MLNFYLHSYFAEVKVIYNKQKYGAFNVNGSAPSNYLNMGQELKEDATQGKYTLKFIVEEIEVMFYEKAFMLQIEWITSPKNDLVADTLCLLILQINEKPTP